MYWYCKLQSFLMPYVVTHTHTHTHTHTQKSLVKWPDLSQPAEYVAVEAESFHLLPHTARHSYVIPMYHNEHVLLYISYQENNDYGIPYGGGSGVLPYSYPYADHMLCSSHADHMLCSSHTDRNGPIQAAYKVNYMYICGQAYMNCLCCRGHIPAAAELP